MRVFKIVCVAACCAGMLAACAKQQARVETKAVPETTVVTAFAGSDALKSVPLEAIEPTPDYAPAPHGVLAGRNLSVGRLEDIVLAENEVVLTFDDGPMPGKTNKILDVLDDYGVKATFLMVGEMANAYPALARKVATRGHTVGTHTQRHANLAGMSLDGAIHEIEKGQASVAAALAPIHREPAPFFRFPYLADSSALRRKLARRGIVVIDVDVDSKDYFSSSPQKVKYRTLSRLDRRKSGIILFHDIHSRTVSMLPEFLDALAAKGYTVVRLVPRRAPDPAELLLSANFEQP